MSLFFSPRSAIRTDSIATYFSYPSRDVEGAQFQPSRPSLRAGGGVSRTMQYLNATTYAALLMLMALCIALAGCGASGYAGGGISGLSNSSVTIDASQQFGFVAAVSGNPLVSWYFDGNSCSGAQCGSLSSTTGKDITYTAPAGLQSQLQLTLTAAVLGTADLTKAAITVNPDPVISGTPPAGTVGAAFKTTLTASGGTAPLHWSMSGSLPAGLTFDDTTGTISGIPTAAGTSNFSAQVTDSSAVPFTVKAAESIAIGAPGGGGVSPLVVVAGNPPAGTVGIPYSTSIKATGGVMPYSFNVISGSLPPGLTISPADGTISGTPTTVGTSSFVAQVMDGAGTQASASFSIQIMPAASGGLHLTMGTLPGATVGVPYTATIGVTGGTGPYSCLQTGGTLPDGLALASDCEVRGTPTTAGTATVTIMASDASSPAATVTGPESITVAAVGTLALSSPPSASVGVPYTGTIGVTGGTAPYSCSLTAGTLPAGLTLGTGCVITGTPTTAGAAILTVHATDTSSPVKSITGPVTLTVVGQGSISLTLATLPGGTVGVPYSATIGVTGGTSPYACSLVSGLLPAGLTENSCVISGTPTAAGTANLSVKATDASTPQLSTTGPESLTISPAPLALTLSTLPGATVGVPYSATIGVTGGTSPYACSLVSGTLPAGLTENSCVISGTPTVAGTANLMVKATDASTPQLSTTGPESLTVSPAPLALTLSNLPNATVGTPYTATIGVTGGTAPYNCTIVSGTLPAGLSNTGCVVSGTPTVAGTVNLMVKATDSSNPVETTTGPVSLTVLPSSPTLTITSPPPATVGVPYSGPIGVTGGTAPYSCTLVSGTLPAGLSLSGCTVTGTPTTPGSSTVQVKATDSSNPAVSSTGPVTVTVLPATSTLTLSSPPNGMVSVPYTGSIGVSGGSAPYLCTITSGTLPAGLSLGAGCAITGTPTVAGTVMVTVHATDSASPLASVTGPVSITIQPIPPLTLAGSLPNATLGVPYTQTLHAAGGITPYTYSLTAGTLPAGITLAPDGTISGTPTAVGASSFTVTVTDTEPTPQTASLPLVLLVVYPTTPTDAELTGPYAFLFQGYDDVLLGVFAYQTATVGSFTADGTGVVSAGELDANHESSNPAGNTISSNQFLGTYTLGTDNRGMLTISTLNADGTVAGTATYAITVKAPVAPATVATQADLIEFDGNQLQGTKGSGTMLAQTTTAFSAGLNGSYAFGLSGDTPCLPSCSLGLVAGPVASVGQFSTDGAGLLTGGASDANIATTNYPNEALTGSYGATDANGRVALTMDTANTPAGSYPTDYAVYLVNGNQAFVMSTDKHSAYVLLAGTAQLQQALAPFSNASMNGPIIGYENAQSNPGLLGALLQNTLNLSTATVFRATGNGSGTCDTTNVDVAGLTSLINGLTGIGSGNSILNALLGTYQSTGNSVCTVAANGRGVLNYPAPSGLLTIILQTLGLPTTAPPAREFYLVSPNNGYFLETGYAGLGRFESQSGAPFSIATLAGTYVYASQPATSLASIDSSGTFSSQGTGSATTTADLNIGVGTINVLQTDVTTTSTYSLTDATAGRYLLGASTVIYAISPNRFVLVDTNPLTTSPSVSLLY